MISWSLLALNLMTPFLCCLVKQNAVPEGSAPIPFCMMKKSLPPVSWLSAKSAASSCRHFPSDF